MENRNQLLQDQLEIFLQYCKNDSEKRFLLTGLIRDLSNQLSNEQFSGMLNSIANRQLVNCDKCGLTLPAGKILCWDCHSNLCQGCSNELQAQNLKGCRCDQEPTNHFYSMFGFK